MPQACQTRYLVHMDLDMVGWSDPSYSWVAEARCTMRRDVARAIADAPNILMVQNPPAWYWHFVYPWDWYFAGLPLHKILRAVLGLRGVGVPVAVDTGTWMSTRLYLLDVHRYRAMVGSLAQQSPDVLHSRATDTWETTVTKLARKAGLRRHGLIDATRSWSVHFPNQQLRPDGDEKGPLDLDSMQVAINRVVQRGVAVTSNKEYTAANVYKWVHKAKWLDNVADDVDISTRSVVLTVSIYVVSFAAVLGATYYGLRILFNGGQIT